MPNERMHILMYFFASTFHFFDSLSLDIRCSLLHSDLCRYLCLPSVAWLKCMCWPLCLPRFFCLPYRPSAFSFSSSSSSSWPVCLPCSVLMGWGQWRTAPVAMTTQGASTARTALTEAASSCVTSSSCPSKTSPAPATCSCTAGEEKVPGLVARLWKKMDIFFQTSVAFFFFFFFFGQFWHRCMELQ